MRSAGTPLAFIVGGVLRSRLWWMCVVCACGCGVKDFPTDDHGAPACVIVQTDVEIGVTNLDKTDILFVIDDGPSMVEEQASIQRELPRLVETLLTGGPREGVDPHTGIAFEPFPPLKDVHVGVISADLGTSGATGALSGCTQWGDDGLLQHTPRGEGCADTYPTFLEYHARHPLAQPPPRVTPATVAADLGCVANLGTSGCGYAQPLEATLKALWPSMDIDPETGEAREPNRVSFLGDATGSLGHGDRENADFLRNDVRAGISLLGIVIVTDKDDCSVANPDPFVGAAVETQDPARHCWLDSPNLQALSRYAPSTEGDPLTRSHGALRWLRYGYEQLVTLTVITGVPPDAIDPTIDRDDDSARDASYETILSDPRMQPSELPDGTVAPVCETEHGRATPAPRLVDAARRFGPFGQVLSICDEDWKAAIDPFLPGIAIEHGAVCLPHSLMRQADGTVDCRVVWELSRPSETLPGAPSRCDEVPALLRTYWDDPITDDGRERCLVEQLAVTGLPDQPQVEAGYGWYYDDFSDFVRRNCSSTTPQLITFSEGAEPPSGVTVRLQCQESRYVVPATGRVLASRSTPTLDAPCDPADPDACARYLLDSEPPSYELDRTMICHPSRGICVVPCGEDDACPRGWDCKPGSPPTCKPEDYCRVPG